MEQKIYKVVFGTDTLESIAEETGYTVEEIKEWHNTHSYYHITEMHLPLEIILPDYPPTLQPKPALPPEEKKKEEAFMERYVTEPLKYRSEQLTVTKINGMVQNHAETKQEYHVKRFAKDGSIFAEILLAENTITMYPDNLQSAVNLVCGVENIKCNATLEVDRQDGKIKRIADMDGLQERWIKHKQEIYKQYSFLKAADDKKNLDIFVSESEKQMTEQAILQHYPELPFFDLFFDSYLVADGISIAPVAKTYYSQLFDGKPVRFTVTQKAIGENPDVLTIAKEGETDRDSVKLREIEQLYEARYKPVAGYKFSEYVYEYHAEITLNAHKSILESATVRMREAVLNNVELIIDYKLRRIE